MQTLVTIGEFSRLSHLTVTTLRHYHEVGLLTPAQIDPSGYRRYGVSQVQQAQLVRRLRQLDMPVPDVAAVLAAPTEQARDTAIAEHLRRMEETLGRTTQVVASLRSLLQTPDQPLDVEYRTIPASTVVGISERVARSDVGPWCAAAFPEIYGALAGAGSDPAGPGGATYDQQFFECDLGEVMAYAPVIRPIDAVGRVGSTTLPAGRFAVAVHAGGVRRDRPDLRATRQSCRRTRCSAGPADSGALPDRPQSHIDPAAVAHRDLVADRHRIDGTHPPATHDQSRRNDNASHHRTHRLRRRQCPALAQFWAQVLERDVDPDANQYFATIGRTGTERLQPVFMFIAVPEGKVGKNRLHVDLASKTQQADIERALAAGATHIGDFDEYGTKWTTLADIEGNVFDIGAGF